MSSTTTTKRMGASRDHLQILYPDPTLTLTLTQPLTCRHQCTHRVRMGREGGNDVPGALHDAHNSSYFEISVVLVHVSGCACSERTDLFSLQLCLL